MDFYLRNNLWINALVLLYALLIFLGRASYDRSARLLSVWYNEKHGRDAQSKSRSSLARMMERGGVPPWDLAVKAFWFPLITPPGRFVFLIKNQQVLQRLFNKETIIKILRPEDERKG